MLRRRKDIPEEVKIKRFLISKFRLAWRYYSGNRKDAVKSLRCVICGAARKNGEELLADHVAPVIDTKSGFQGWDVYYDRLFNGKLQPLCMSCHDKKTAAEKKERAKARKEAKLKGAK